MGVIDKCLPIAARPFPEPRSACIRSTRSGRLKAKGVVMPREDVPWGWRCMEKRAQKPRGDLEDRVRSEVKILGSGGSGLVLE